LFCPLVAGNEEARSILDYSFVNGLIMTGSGLTRKIGIIKKISRANHSRLSSPLVFNKEGAKSNLEYYIVKIQYNVFQSGTVPVIHKIGITKNWPGTNTLAYIVLL